MDRLANMETFVKVVEAGGFAAAASRLGLSRAVVSKHVMQLEDHLGVRLFNWTTRKVSATEEGAAYYERCLAILTGLADAERAVAKLHDEPRGTLKINAPMSFGTLHLSSAVGDFMARYPGLRVNMVLNDRFLDQVEDGFDIGIRIGALEDSSLIARRIAPSRRVLCAAPDYLERRGTPAVPGHLSEHDCLHYGYQTTGMRWQLTGPDGADHSIRITGTLCANNGEVLRDAAVRGLGIALLPTFIVGAELQEGRLRTLLPEYTLPDTAVYAIYPQTRHLSAKVRLFIDFLVERFGQRPPWALVD